jgi:hypothetical protein
MHWLDPDYLPEVRGTVDRFLLNPHGYADGMIRTDGAEIHFPPRVSAEVLNAVQLGATIKVRGVRPRTANVIAAVTIEAADGARIVGQDGRIVRFPQDRAAEVAELLAAGAQLVVRGDGLTTPIGSVIEAHEMGSSDANLHRLSPKEPKKKSRKHKPEDDAFPMSEEDEPAA